MEPVAKIEPSSPAEVLMNQRAAGAIHRRIVALAFAAWIFDFYDLVLYSFLLVPVARELHLTPDAVVAGAGDVAADDSGRRSDLRIPRRSLRAQADDRGDGRNLRRRHSAVRIQQYSPATDRVSIDCRTRHRRRMGARTEPRGRERAGRQARAIRRIRADGRAAGSFAGGGRRRISGAGAGMAADVHAVRSARDIRRRRRAEVDAGE